MNSNNNGSIGKLKSLLRQLKKDPELMNPYGNIVQQQLVKGTIKKVTAETTGSEFYLPYKPPICKSAESMNVRILFDGSARENEQNASFLEEL